MKVTPPKPATLGMIAFIGIILISAGVNVANATTITDTFYNGDNWNTITGAQRSPVYQNGALNLSVTNAGQNNGVYSKNATTPHDFIATINYKSSSADGAVFYFGYGGNSFVSLTTYMYVSNSASNNIGIYTGTTTTGTYTITPGHDYNVTFMRKNNVFYAYINGTLVVQKSSTIDLGTSATITIQWQTGGGAPGGWHTVFLSDYYYDDDGTPKVTVEHNNAYIVLTAIDQQNNILLDNCGYNFTHAGISEYGYYDQVKNFTLLTNYTYEIEVNRTNYVPWTWTIYEQYNTVPDYKVSMNANLYRIMADPANQTLVHLSFVDSNYQPVHTIKYLVENATWNTTDYLIGYDEVHVVLWRGQEYTFYGWDTMAKHYGAISTETIPNNSDYDVQLQLRDIPGAGTLNPNVNNTYLDIYKGNIDGQLQAFRDGFNLSAAYQFSALDNYTNAVNNVTTEATSANGTISAYVGIINAFGVCISAIPTKVQFVITYYLTWLVALVILNR